MFGRCSQTIEGVNKNVSMIEEGVMKWSQEVKEVMKMIGMLKE